MSNANVRDGDTEARVRDYAHGLGLTDERAVAAALHRMRTHVRWGTGPALEDARALLRSWSRHPSHRAAAAGSGPGRASAGGAELLASG